MTTVLMQVLDKQLEAIEATLLKIEALTRDSDVEGAQLLYGTFDTQIESFCQVLLSDEMPLAKGDIANKLNARISSTVAEIEIAKKNIAKQLMTHVNNKKKISAYRNV